eukprot:CAMPEP_0171723224 /NCGR_PEP_ID=MMETSP0991-20121206/23533_1 /TAXON_ID=483369 /ORGANISM="non described non described, Strain CCMP2098" /LENGTH=290 /DNA_ID=CAMNT_0012315655 /DNA_START=10 /DNA_END=883 /DNA_ORIENTATION=-
MARTGCALLFLASVSEAFLPQAHNHIRKTATRNSKSSIFATRETDPFDPFGFTASASAAGDFSATELVGASASSGKGAVVVGAASSGLALLAGDGDFVPRDPGVSLHGGAVEAHPGLAKEVSELKTLLRVPESSLAKLEAAQPTSEGEAVPQVSSPQATALRAEITDLSSQIADKSAERKDLVGLDFRDRHWALGSALLGLGVCFAIEGPVNTYMRAGKLFPGPHVYAACAIVCMWALGAALVPQMQKGKEWARSTHIGLNVASVALFAYYQIPTGLQITAKVLEFTKFP